MENKLTVSLSPHLHSHNSISRSMWNVIIALIPALAVAIWTFGVDALWVIAVSVCACMLTEWLIERFMFHRPCTLMNGSAIITGLLLAFNLPSILPWWMVVVGAVVAIGIGKMSFGGLGCNIWNPALVGRVFLLISFPAAMTTWPAGVSSGLVHMSGASGADATTGATLLATLNDSNGEIGMSQRGLYGYGNRAYERLFGRSRFNRDSHRACVYADHEGHHMAHTGFDDRFGSFVLLGFRRQSSA